MQRLLKCNSSIISELDGELDSRSRGAPAVMVGAIWEGSPDDLVAQVRLRPQRATCL